ncbi:MAG: hypothetical protein ACOCW6_10845, partial [Spirochaetota bacterium]
LGLAGATVLRGPMGFGAIDFAEVMEILDRVGFTSGRLGIEGNIKETFDADIRRSAELLRPLISSI